MHARYEGQVGLVVCVAADGVGRVVVVCADVDDDEVRGRGLRREGVERRRGVVERERARRRVGSVEELVCLPAWVAPAVCVR